MWCFKNIVILYLLKNQCRYYVYCYLNDFKLYLSLQFLRKSLNVFICHYVKFNINYLLVFEIVYGFFKSASVVKKWNKLLRALCYIIWTRFTYKYTYRITALIFCNNLEFIFINMLKLVNIYMYKNLIFLILCIYFISMIVGLII